jgi:ribosomal protein S18 acetylase RimI-like enzyme
LKRHEQVCREFDRQASSARLRLRTFESADQPAVWELHNRALEGTGAHAGNGPWDDDLRDPRASYLERGAEFVVGLIDDELVAMGALVPTAPDSAEIKRMRVQPVHQRLRLGSRILEELERRARGRGFSRLHLDTTVQQVAAQRFYEHHGYRETGRGRLGPFELILYEKRIGQADAEACDP